MWEIAIKKTIHKLNLAESVTDLEEICNDYGITILPVKPRYLDRLIMATALEEKLLLITCDSNIRKYDIELFW